MNEIKKVGVIAMPRISTGGGFQRVAYDLMVLLNKMGKEVHLLTPFYVYMKKMKELYGDVKIDKIHYTNKIVTQFAREPVLGRKLMVNDFKKFAEKVDFIIDLDGGVFHNYLPRDFPRERYVVWRLSCINPNTYKLQKDFNPKILIKKFVRSIVSSKKDIPHNVRIYPLDEWTKKEIIQFWNVKPEDMCLYPEIKVEDFKPKKKRKKQMVVLGRISQNKSVHESLEIFSKGTQLFPDYKLVILGGTTPDSEKYIKQLEEQAKNLGIEKRVEIVRNPSFSKIKDILSESEILLDSQKGVSLTMTAIEAMASGCIVLAQKNAGTYQEVLEKGKYGYGFSTINEGVEELKKITSALKNKKLTNKNAIERAEFFSPESFIKRLNKIF